MMILTQNATSTLTRVESRHRHNARSLELADVPAVWNLEAMASTYLTVGTDGQGHPMFASSPSFGGANWFCNQITPTKKDHSQQRERST